MNGWIGPAILMAVLVADVIWVGIGIYRDHRQPDYISDVQRIEQNRNIYLLEHQLWPDQTRDWYSHDSMCNKCAGGHTHSISTGPPTHLPEGWTYTVLKGGVGDPIRYEAIEITALGQVEPMYVPGRKIPDQEP